MLLFQLPFKIPPPILNLYNQVYGDHAGRNRGWYILFTICVLMLFFKNYRKLGGFALVFLVVCMFLWNWVQDAYYQFTPH